MEVWGRRRGTYLVGDGAHGHETRGWHRRCCRTEILCVSRTRTLLSCQEAVAGFLATKRQETGHQPGGKTLPKQPEISRSETTVDRVQLTPPHPGRSLAFLVDPQQPDLPILTSPPATSWTTPQPPASRRPTTARLIQQEDLPQWDRVPARQVHQFIPRQSLGCDARPRSPWRGELRDRLRERNPKVSWPAPGLLCNDGHSCSIQQPFRHPTRRRPTARGTCL